MIERSALPTNCRVASATVRAETGFVRVIHAVACEAILRRLLEIDQIPGIDMALHADYIHMRSRQLERNHIMVKPFAEPVRSIVTVQAGGTKRQYMGLGKDRIDLTVAGLAHVRSKGSDIFTMTICAGERFVPGRPPVPVQ